MTLSQEDIDKILTGGDATSGGDNTDAIRLKYQNGFKPHIETIFSTLTGEKMEVNIKGEGRATAAELPKVFEGEWLGFKGTLDVGKTITTGHLMSMPLALIIAGKIMGQETPDALNDAHAGALKEAANNLIGAWVTNLGEILSVDAKPAGEVDVFKADAPAALAAAKGITGEELTIWRYAVSLGGAEAEYILLFPAGHLKEIIMMHPEYSPGTPVKQDDSVAAADVAAKKDRSVSTMPKQEVEKAVFQPFEGDAPVGEPSQIQLLLDVPLTVSVELGRKRLSIKEILDMVPGSLLELDKLAGEPVDLMVNGKLFARGEVVVIDENFGVRIANIVSPKERLERLK